MVLLDICLKVFIKLSPIGSKERKVEDFELSHNIFFL